MFLVMADTVHTAPVPPVGALLQSHNLFENIGRDASMPRQMRGQPHGIEACISSSCADLGLVGRKFETWPESSSASLPTAPKNLQEQRTSEDTVRVDGQQDQVILSARLCLPAKLRGRKNQSNTLVGNLCVGRWLDHDRSRYDQTNCKQHRAAHRCQTG